MQQNTAAVANKASRSTYQLKGECATQLLPLMPQRSTLAQLEAQRNSI
jgi:hypothetical protein